MVAGLRDRLRRLGCLLLSISKAMDRLAGIAADLGPSVPFAGAVGSSGSSPGHRIVYDCGLRTHSPVSSSRHWVAAVDRAGSGRRAGTPVVHLGFPACPGGKSAKSVRVVAIFIRGTGEPGLVLAPSSAACSASIDWVSSPTLRCYAAPARGAAADGICFRGMIFDAQTNPRDCRTSEWASGDRRTPNAPESTISVRECVWPTLWHTMTRARGATALIARIASGQGKWSVPACMSTAITVRDRPTSWSPDKSEARSMDQQKSRPMDVRSRRSFEKSPRRTTHPLLVMATSTGSFVAKPEQHKCHTDNLDPLLAQQPDFDHLRQAQIGEQRQQQDRPVQPRKVLKTQRGSQWGIGQPHAEGHDG